MDASLGGRFPRTIVYKRRNTSSLTDSALQNNTADGLDFFFEQLLLKTVNPNSGLA